MVRGHEVADIALTPASVGRIEVRAASVRGRQHRAVGDPRQDDFALGVADGEDLIAVVCDGVGLFPQSHQAASLAARRLVAMAGRGEAWPAAFAVVNEELDAQAWDDPAKEQAKLTMATTVLAVRVRSDVDGWHGQAAWVGDSPLWHLSPDGRWTGCTHSAVGEDEGPNRTWSSSLPSPNLLVAETELDLDDGALFLMSDGVGDPLGEVDEIRSTLAQRWATAPDIFEFGHQVDFARETYVDDRTVVGLWSRP